MATHKSSLSVSGRGRHQHQQERVVHETAQSRPDHVGDPELTRSGTAEYRFQHCQVLVDYKQQRVRTIFTDGAQIFGLSHHGRGVRRSGALTWL